MIVLINLVVIGFIGLVIYGGVLIYKSLTTPERTNVTALRNLAKDASKAAKRGDYAERDRLDHAYNQLLKQMNPNAETFEGSDHDSFSDRYFEQN